MIRKPRHAAARTGLFFAILVACAFLSKPAAAAGLADHPPFRNPQPVTIEGYDGDAMEPFITKDGRFLLFNNNNTPPERTDLFYAERIDDLTFIFRGPIAGANSPALDGVASVDQAGELYFISTRSYDQTLSTLYRGHFDKGVASGIELVPGVSPHVPGLVDFDAEISGDGQDLYVAEGDFRPFGRLLKSARIVLFHQAAGAFERAADSDRSLAAVNGPGLVYAQAISADGLELLFTRVAAIEPGAMPAIERALRPSNEVPFGPPERVEAASGFVEAPTLSADGRRLYFHKRDGDRFRIWEAAR